MALLSKKSAKLYVLDSHTKSIVTIVCKLNVTDAVNVTGTTE